MQTLRDVTDQPYRLGGDEAAAILPGISLADAKTLAEDIRSKVATKFVDKVLPDGKTPTVSIGVGTVTARLEPDDFHRRADAIAYRAKQTRNTVEAELLNP